MRCYPNELNLEYHTGYLNKEDGEVVDDQFFIIPKKLQTLLFLLNLVIFLY